MITTFIWSTGFFLVLNYDVLEFRTIISAFFTVNFINFFTINEYKLFTEDPFFKAFYVLDLYILFSRVVTMSIFTSSVIYYLRKARGMEKNEIMTP